MDEKPHWRSPRMVRIGISVEGVTEERFVKMVLAPYLADKQIFVTAISMGGDVKLDRVRAELKKIAYGFDYVSTFYDFYGFKGRADDESKGSLERKMKDHVHENIRNRIIPYIQMYEFEGLLFSSPEALATHLQDPSVIEWSTQVLHEFENNPERINNSKETAPSKRLGQRTKYRKTTHGPNIAKEIGIEKLREMCNGFDEWLNQMEELAA